MSLSLETMFRAGRSSAQADRSAIYVCLGMLVLAAIIIAGSAAAGIGSPAPASAIIVGP